LVPVPVLGLEGGSKVGDSILAAGSPRLLMNKNLFSARVPSVLAGRDSF
jgi:hypothetical protein